MKRSLISSFHYCEIIIDIRNIFILNIACKYMFINLEDSEGVIFADDFVNVTFNKENLFILNQN